MTTATESPTYSALPWASAGNDPTFIGVPSFEVTVQPQIMRADLVGDRIRAGEHRDDAGRRERGGGVNLVDCGVRVGRAHEIGVGLARTIDVVDVAAPAGDKTKILFALDGCADAGRVHATLPGVFVWFRSFSREERMSSAEKTVNSAYSAALA